VWAKPACPGAAAAWSPWRHWCPRTDQFGSHLRRALANGLTKDELVPAITHLAFYAGWPNAMTAITVLKKITEE
jgi:alkylhydroperoxidase/carboxymuconolactone decarboxylase family protein YurZ